MSERTKGIVNNIVHYLANAGSEMISAARNANLVGDKVLVEKVKTAQKSISDVTEYIKSKTGQGA